jgi:S1-C subfamily serine protease
LKLAGRILFYARAYLPLWDVFGQGKRKGKTMLLLRWLRKLGVSVGLAITLSGVPVSAQIPDLNTGRVPTLAPLVKEVTPAVVNISVQGRVREDNPLYQDPLFREFFNVPRQLEKEVNATGSGVIVDAQRGYVLTANQWRIAFAPHVSFRLMDRRSLWCSNNVQGNGLMRVAAHSNTRR